MNAFAVVLTVLLQVSSVAATDFVPFLLLNDGVVDSTKSCTTTEWTHVVTEVQQAIVGQRQRRRHNVRRALSAQSSSRHLAIIRCDGRYTSYFPYCAGRTSRRRVRGLGVEHSGHNATTSPANLNGTITATGVEGTPCENDAIIFDSVLSRLMTQSSMVLSSPCLAYLASTREYTCREPVACDIHRFDLWNATSDTRLQTHLPPTGTQVCATDQVNFEAVSNFDLGRVSYTLKGTVLTNVTHSVTNVNTITARSYSYSRREFVAPYFAFGNVGADVHSRTLPVGNYTLTAVSDLAPTKGQTVQFAVVNC
jgi:hypothetical protein